MLALVLPAAARPDKVHFIRHGLPACADLSGGADGLGRARCLPQAMAGLARPHRAFACLISGKGKRCASTICPMYECQDMPRIAHCVKNGCNGITSTSGWCPISDPLDRMKSCDDTGYGRDVINAASGTLVVAWEHHAFAGLFRQLKIPVPRNFPGGYTDIWTWDSGTNQVSHSTMNYHCNYNILSNTTTASTL